MLHWGLFTTWGLGCTQTVMHTPEGSLSDGSMVSASCSPKSPWVRGSLGWAWGFASRELMTEHPLEGRQHNFLKLPTYVLSFTLLAFEGKSAVLTYAEAHVTGYCKCGLLPRASWMSLHADPSLSCLDNGGLAIFDCSPMGEPDAEDTDFWPRNDNEICSFNH